MARSVQLQIQEVQETSQVSLWYLFWTFLKIGSVAFGGFMSLISVIESIIVDRRGLMKQEDMLDGISLANLLPGPMAVNVVAYIGYRLRGGVGALVSAVGVILPSFILLVVLTHLYFAYGEIDVLSKAFRGFIPAVSAIILSVVWRMSKKTIKGMPEAILVIVAASALLLIPRQFKIYVTFGIVATFGLIGYYLFRTADNKGSSEVAKTELPIRRITIVLGLLGSLIVLSLLPLPLEPNGIPRLSLTLSGLSVMLFGGGYVFIPMIQDVVVGTYGWLTEQQFIDGIALGQVTPGPILISAAFIGQRVAGLLGALLATIAIFTPPAVLMVTASEMLDYLKQSAAMQAAMRGIRSGVIGMIFVASFVILKASVPSWPPEVSTIWPTLLILCASLVALIKFKVDVVWIIPIAGILGYILY